MPQRTIVASFNRVEAAAVATLFGTALTAHFGNNNASQGYLTSPLKLPEDFDVSRPSYLYAPFSAGQAGPSVPQAVVLYSECTRVSPGLVGQNLANSTAIATPANWATSDVIYGRMDGLIGTPTGFTYAAGAFLPTDTVSFKIRRMGSDPLDTYAGPVKLFDSLYLVFSRRCQLL
jgi:hypothetical protein